MDLLFNVILNILNAGLTVYTFMLFFNSFAPRRFNRSSRAIFSSVIVIIFTALLLVLENGIIKTVILIGITICISRLYYIKWTNSILLSLAVFAIGSLSEFVTTILISILFSVNAKQALEGPYYVLGVLISKFITLIPIIVIKTSIQRKQYGISGKKSLPLLLIPVSTIITLSFYSILTNQMPVQSEALNFASLLCYAVLTVSNIVLFDLIEHIYRDAEKDKQLTLAQELMRHQEDQYQQLLLHNEAVLKIRHDQKNFLIGLLAELDNENYHNIRLALQEEYDLLTAPSASDRGNSIFDAVVQSKMALIANENISIDCDYRSIQKIPISPIDLSVILGNALDNAIEAARRVDKTESKTISLMAKVHNDNILIIIRNPVAQFVDVNNPVSAKRNNEAPGLGITSMKSIAAKYDGDVILNCTEDTFETHIILRNKADV